MLKVADKKKALSYVTPLAGVFNVALTVRSDERESLMERADLVELWPALEEAPNDLREWRERP
jgi:hypothetical protein